LQLRDTSGGGPTLNGPIINNGGWHHLVAVHDGTTDYLYVDGVEAASTDFDHAGFDSTAPLNIGWFNNRSGSTHHFNGTIDEVVIYGKALTDVEVEHRFNKGLDKLALCELPAIDIKKSPGFQSVPYDTTATFTVAVTNVNPITITNVVVTDSEAPNCSTTIASLGPGQKSSYVCIKNNVVAEFTNSASVQAKTLFGQTSMSDAALNAAKVDIPSSMSVKKTASSTTLPAPGGTITYTVRITNTSKVDAITISTMTDDKIPGNLNAQCGLPKLILKNNVHQCTYTDSVTGSSGYVETGTVTVSGNDDDGIAINGNASSTVSIGPGGGGASDTNVFLPVVIKQ